MASSNRSEFESRQDDRAIRRRAAVLRYRGYRGITILGHRAFRTLPLKPWNLLHSAILAVVLTLAWVAVSPSVGRLWGAILESWFPVLQLQGAVTVVESVPQVSTPAAVPNAATLITVGILTALVLFISFRLSAALTPMSYLLRAFCFIQATAIFYFAFFPSYFPHNLPGYISTMFGSTMAFISAIPAIMSFTFYIFDLSFGRKLLLTVLAMAHLIVLTPIQYLIHVYIIASWSSLFMPVLYIMFGLLPQIGIFIAFYSWGMSWPSGEKEVPW